MCAFATLFYTSIYTYWLGCANFFPYFHIHIYSFTSCVCIYPHFNDCACVCECAFMTCVLCIRFLPVSRNFSLPSACNSCDSFAYAHTLAFARLLYNKPETLVWHMCGECVCVSMFWHLMQFIGNFLEYLIFEEAHLLLLNLEIIRGYRCRKR